MPPSVMFAHPASSSSSCSSSSSSSSTTAAAPHTSTSACTPASSYLPVLVGSTAACLILNQSYARHDSSHPQHAFANQNYFNVKDQINSSSLILNSSAGGNFPPPAGGGGGGMTTGGVLHPSNRNNIKPSKRNLFTSTPMGGGGLMIDPRTNVTGSNASSAGNT